MEKVVTYLVSWAGEETMQGNSLKVVYADTDEEVLNSETLVTEGSVLKIIPTAVAGYHLSALSYTISGLQNVPFTIGNEPYTFTVEGGTEDPKMGYFVIISAGFTPDTYDASVVDYVYKVSNDDAILTSRKLASSEGLLVGISSGAAVYAALQLSLKSENENKNIVVILPDTGERYLSTVLYAFEEYPLQLTKIED